MDRVRNRFALAGVDASLAKHLDRLWKYGLAPIQDEALRDLVIRFLAEEAPDGFYYGAATRSGKHHPRWHNGTHGILQNTCECCALIPGLAWSFPSLVDRTAKKLRQEYVDAALAATIVSDAFKWNHESEWTDDAHLMLACGAWIRFTTGVGQPWPLVHEGVRWHHGIYSPGGEHQVMSDYRMLVHLADAFFAQKVLHDLYDPR